MILLRFACLDSTQSFLRRHPELGCCGVLAERQTGGRGRWGNRWEGDGGLYLSAAIPDPGLPPGVALQRAMLHAIACLGSPALGLKWPNDLVARREGGLAKVGGILGELDGGRLILGLGINLRDAPKLESAAMPAASLLELGLAVADPEALALSILAAWEALGAAPEPAFRWPTQGEAVRWQEGQGVVLGWEDDGRLRIANQTGVVRLASGDVSRLRAMAGSDERLRAGPLQPSPMTSRRRV